MCLKKIHLECIDIPFKLLLRGAYYYDLKEKEYAELLNIFETFKNLDLRRSHNEIIALKNRVIDILQGDDSLYYLCYTC